MIYREAPRRPVVSRGAGTEIASASDQGAPNAEVEHRWSQHRGGRGKDRPRRAIALALTAEGADVVACDVLL
jgi:hypothetical protein